MASVAQHINTYKLDPDQRGGEATAFELALRSKIVGQDEAVDAVADLYQTFRAGLNSPGRPVGTLLFLGPTGAGKTRVAEATAEVLFGDPKAIIRIDCAEFQHSHEIAKLLGSPPGYLGKRTNWLADFQGVTPRVPSEIHERSAVHQMLFFLRCGTS